ncbi:hypothetical protein [Nonlabens sp. Asnod3-H03]|uniref:hypothetical protein n=1 Tax=Nonlabens sp. Asnod3-H03 TaxID=3160580 RepID=UPI00386CB33C
MRLLKLYNVFCLLLTISLLTSCGYSTTEDDKYPDMAEFPEVDGTGIELEKYHINFEEVYVIGDDLLGISFKEKEIYAVRMDQSFDKLDSVKISEYYYVSPDGFVYFKKEDDRIAKVHYLEKRFQDLDVHPFFKERFYESKLAELAPQYDFEVMERATEKGKDSVREIAAQHHYDQIKNRVIPDITSYHTLDNDAYLSNGYVKLGGLIIQTQDGDFYIPKDIKAHRWHDEFKSRIDWFRLLEDIDQLPAVEKFSTSNHTSVDYLTLFDQAVIENRGSGNHYVFGFYPVTYDYYTLEFNGKTAKFKSYDSVMSAFQSPDGRTVIIYDKQKGWYRVRPL